MMPTPAEPPPEKSRLWRECDRVVELVVFRWVTSMGTMVVSACHESMTEWKEDIVHARIGEGKKMKHAKRISEGGT